MVRFVICPFPFALPLSVILASSFPLSVFCFGTCWFPQLTHPQIFGGCMWLCGIIASLLTIEGVKQRTTSLLLHDHNTLGPHHYFFPFPTPNLTHSKQLLQRKSCWSRAEGQQNKLFSQLVSMQGWIWGQTPPHPHISVCLSLYSSLSVLFPVCFSFKGKLKPLRFVFLLFLAECLLFRPRCWWTGSHLSEKHEVDCRAMGKRWMGARLTWLDFVWRPSHVWMFSSFKPVGQSVSC